MCCGDGTWIDASLDFHQKGGSLITRLARDDNDNDNNNIPVKMNHALKKDEDGDRKDPGNEGRNNIRN